MQDKPIQRFYYFVYYVDNYQRYVVADHVLWHWAQYWRDYYFVNFNVRCEIEMESLT